MCDKLMTKKGQYFKHLYSRKKKKKNIENYPPDLSQDRFVTFTVLFYSLSDQLCKFCINIIICNLHLNYMHCILYFISVHLICLPSKIIRKYRSVLYSFSLLKHEGKNFGRKRTNYKILYYQNISCVRNISFNVMVANLLYRQYKFKESLIGNK